MWGRKKRAERAKPTEILSHWPRLIEKLQYSPQEFYGKIEQALAERQVPELQYERVEWPEGGFLSDRREYLRIRRERLVFDVCGAPFGTGFFVSIWCGEKPLKMGIWAVLAALSGGLGLIHLLSSPHSPAHRLLLETLGLTYEYVGYLLLGAVLLLGCLIVVKVGPNLDAFLMDLPMFGYFYQKYFRRITLYRIDRTCMYQAAVHAAVVQVIDEICAVHCIQPMSDLERRPVLRELHARAGVHGHA